MKCYACQKIIKHKVIKRKCNIYDSYSPLFGGETVIELCSNKCLKIFLKSEVDKLVRMQNIYGRD